MNVSYKLFFRSILIICILVILYNNFNIQNYTEPKYKLVVVAIFKNEAVAMKEWLQHYVNQGVEHFYMINNGSTDNWKPEIKGFPVTIYDDDEQGKQTKHYNNYCLEIVKKNAEWVMVVDLDEFMYARKGFKTIPEYLNSLGEDVKQVHVRWIMFGSNGHIKQPKSMIKGFTRRDFKAHDVNVKSICRTKDFVKFAVHTHNIGNGIPDPLFPVGKTAETGNILLPAINSSSDLDNAPLHLNHYVIQSWDYYKNNKITRGDVVNINHPKSSDGIRKGSPEYFKFYDRNHVLDTELSNMTP